MILSDDEKQLLNNLNCIKDGTYPAGNCWDGTVFSTGTIELQFIYFICNDRKIFSSVEELHIHGRTHLKDARRVLSLKEFL